jgi:hypothetical protein
MNYYYYIYSFVGRNSSVGIATGYGLNGPGIESSVFGGLGVSMLASGTQDRRFAPDRSRPIFPAGKIYSMPSFGRGSKIICSMLVTRTTKKVKKGQNSQNGQKRSTMVQKKNPSGGEIFRTCPDWPWGLPSLLYNGSRVFPGSKAAWAWC